MVEWMVSRVRRVLPLFQWNSPLVVMRFALLHLLKRERVLEMRVHGVRIFLRSATPDLLVALESLGGELDEAITLLPRDTTGLIIDAGGYIGTAAIKLASAFPNAEIITVEPAPDNLDLLRRNVANTKNIRVVPKALAGVAGGSVELWDTDLGEWGYSTAVRGKTAAAFSVVRTVTIEEIMADAEVKEIRLLKLDIEAAEIDVLSRSEGWIQDTHILVIELHERMVKGCEAAFERATIGRMNRPLRGEKVLSVAMGMAEG